MWAKWRRLEWPLTKEGSSVNPQQLTASLLRWDGESFQPVHYTHSVRFWKRDEQLFDAEYDPLGFRWPTDSEEKHALAEAYAFEWEHLSTVRDDWLEYIRGNPLLTSTSTNRALSRKGIPQSLRAYCWAVVLGSVHVCARNPGCYRQLYSRKLDESIAMQINLDVPRTFPSHAMFREGHGSHQNSLRRVLHAFAVYNPAVNYCQSLNFLAGILLINMPEELAFWSLVQLVDSRLYSRGFSLCSYYCPDMYGLRRDMYVFGELVRMKLPYIYEVSGGNIEWLCSHWLLCLYSTRIPLPLCLRIWDSFMLEGDKILFRVGLAILRCLQNKFKEMATKEAEDGAISVLRGDLTQLNYMPVESIMATAFKERLKRSEINNLRSEWQRKEGGSAGKLP